MDCKKVGALLQALRREKGMTQKQLAALMNISDKTVSKWETGAGCPDVSLLAELARILGVKAETILTGSLDENNTDGGNMKRIQFYVCPVCGNVVTAAAAAEVSCCGRRLEAQKEQPCDEAHEPKVEEADGEWYITFDHEMTKEHYLQFVACVRWDRVMLVRLYPEQGGEVRIPQMRRGRLVFGCSRDGVFGMKL